MARMNNPSPAISASPVASSPSSMAFSAMSEHSASEDERLGSAFAKSPRGLIDSPMSPDRPLIRMRHNTSARRLAFDDDDDMTAEDSDSAAPSVRGSVNAARTSVGPAVAIALSGDASRASTGPAVTADVGPVPSMRASAPSRTPARADNVVEPPMSELQPPPAGVAAPAAVTLAQNSASGLTRAQNMPEISGEVLALKQALLVAKKEAADAKYLADIREKEVTAMRNDLRAKELAYDRELERVQVLEEKLLTRNARVQSLEKERAAVAEELANRDLLITDMRAKLRQVQEGGGAHCWISLLTQRATSRGTARSLLG
jgi:hypothetical protein